MSIFRQYNQGTTLLIAENLSDCIFYSVKNMPLTKKPTHIFEPTSLQCGQAVIAMLGDVSVEEVIKVVKTERETTLKDMKSALKAFGIDFLEEKKSVTKKEELPKIAMLSLETPKCWHWSLYFGGKFFDPEFGVLDDFPICNRKFYWEIKS